MSLKIENNGDIIIFEGIIDENSNLTDGVKISNVFEEVTLNLENITKINSFGVRAWVDFINLFPDKMFTYQRCSNEIVKQITMVPEFLCANTRIESFFAIYYCDQCNEEFKVLIETPRKNSPLKFEAPIQSCTSESCSNAPMSLDEDEDDFNSFMETIEQSLEDNSRSKINEMAKSTIEVIARIDGRIDESEKTMRGKSLTSDSIFLSSQTLFPIGTRLNLKFDLDRSYPIDLVAEVKWHRKGRMFDSSDSSGMSVKFISFNKDSEKNLRSYIYSIYDSD